MSRALPDIRDGLKPVQRRILHAMYANLRLTPDARYRKSATGVGEVMGKYHLRGDTAIYDAMVRMAQDFSLRDPLVDGQRHVTPFRLSERSQHIANWASIVDRLSAGWDDDEFQIIEASYPWCETLSDDCDCHGAK